MWMLLGTASYAGTCASGWSCETVWAGSIVTDAIDIAVGGGIVASVSETGVWIFFNRVVEDSADTFENQLLAAKVSCNSAGCGTHGSGYFNWIEIAERAGQQANTAPSLAIDPDEELLHFAAVADDPLCSTGTQNALYGEWETSYALLYPTYALIDGGGCDEDWGHGLITYNATSTEMVVGVTWKDGDEVAVFGKRDIGTGTWTTPPNTVGASESDHISPAYRVSNGNNRYAYHDKTGDDIIFASSSSELDIGDGDWPVLVMDSVNSPASWRVVWAEDSGSNSLIRARKCNVTDDCFDINNWGTLQTLYTRTGIDHVRAIDYALAQDGSLHLFWVDNDSGTVNDRFRYAKKCPSGSWDTSPSEVWTPDNGVNLDIGRPHMAFYEDGTSGVLLVFADWGTNGSLIFANDLWSCP